MIECLLLKNNCLVIFNYSHGILISCAVLGGRCGWYLKENDHYVYDMFGHGNVIAQPQAKN
jgi:hypothetical protein